MGGLLALLLLLVFAVCVLSVLLTGADTYQTLTRRDQDSYDRRTAAQYLATGSARQIGPTASQWRISRAAMPWS